MSSFFDCLGFSIRKAAEVRALANRAAREGYAMPSDLGMGLRCWRVGSGVELWTEIAPSGEVLGVLPFFDAGSPHVTAVTACEPDPDNPEEGWIEGWLHPTEVDEPYSGVFPVIADLVDFLSASPRLTNLPLTVSLRLVGLTFDAETHEDALSLAEVARGTGFRLPPQSFASSQHVALDGGLSLERPDAMAVFSGTITAASRVINPLTGLAFWHLKVTVGKAVLDFCTPAEAVGEALPGMVLQSSAWMLGSVPAFE